MANATETENGEMEINSPEQPAEMQDVVTSPEMEFQYDSTPCQVDKHLDFIDINESGQLLMGSSSLIGRYWGGGLWFYDDPALAPNVEKCLVGYEVGSGLADGAFLDEKKVLIGQDNGTVEFLSLSTEGAKPHVTSLCRVDEHLDSVLCVEVTCNKKHALTGSFDMSIRMWDCETSAVARLLSVAHSQQVTGLAAHPSNDQLFLSTGMDGNSLLWDLRCQKPASGIYCDWDDKPECVSWVGSCNAESSGGDQLMLGLQSGKVVLKNTSNFKHNVATHQALNRPLYRLAANPRKSTQVAICGNDSKILVVDVVDDAINVCYEDDRHTDFVRGLAWRDINSFVTCGWDKAVLIHNI